MDKVCLTIPDFNAYDGISQLVRRAVHACIIVGIKPFIICEAWKGFIPDGWTLGKVTKDGLFEIEVISIKKNKLYCWDTKKEAMKLLEGATIR